MSTTVCIPDDNVSFFGRAFDVERTAGRRISRFRLPLLVGHDVMILVNAVVEALSKNGLSVTGRHSCVFICITRCSKSLGAVESGEDGNTVTPEVGMEKVHEFYLYWFEM